MSYRASRSTPRKSKSVEFFCCLSLLDPRLEARGTASALARGRSSVHQVPPRGCCWRARPRLRALLFPRRERDATRATAHRGSHPALSARSLSPASRARARWPAARRGDNNNKDHPRRRCVSTSQHAAAGGGPPRATEAAAAEQARLVRSSPPRELRGIAPGGRKEGRSAVTSP